MKSIYLLFGLLFIGCFALAVDVPLTSKYNELSTMKVDVKYTDKPFTVEVKKSVGGGWFVEYTDDNLNTVREWVNPNAEEWYMQDAAMQLGLIQKDGYIDNVATFKTQIATLETEKLYLEQQLTDMKTEICIKEPEWSFCKLS